MPVTVEKIVNECYVSLKSRGSNCGLVQCFLFFDQRVVVRHPPLRVTKNDWASFFVPPHYSL